MIIQILSKLSYTLNRLKINFIKTYINSLKLFIRIIYYVCIMIKYMYIIDRFDFVSYLIFTNKIKIKSITVHFLKSKTKSKSTPTKIDLT